MLPQAMNPRGCPACGSTSASTLQVGRYYVLSRCVDCKLLWDPKYESEPVAIYDQSYFVSGNPEHGYANYQRDMEINRQTFERRLKIAEKLLGKKGKVLDVGCALGYFLEEATRLGWPSPIGIDVSDFAIQECRARGLEVLSASLNNPPFKNETFDVIFLQDVLEHTTDPLTELRRAMNLLTSGGMIFLTTPDSRSWSVRILRGKWYHFKPGEHLTYFSKTNICKLLARAGFERARAKTALNTMGLDYILGRLEPYQAFVIGLVRKVVRRLGISRLPVTAPIGELEAWAFRPQTEARSNVIPMRRKKNTGL